MQPLSLRFGSVAAAATLALLVTTAPAALAGGGDAEVVVDTYDCSSIDVSSSKDLSNVVLEFADGDRERFEGLTSRSGTFAGTGDNSGEVITTAWIKSGANASGDGPGYGARRDFDSSRCDETSGQSPSGQATSADEDSASPGQDTGTAKTTDRGTGNSDASTGRAGGAEKREDAGEDDTTGGSDAVVVVDAYDCTSVEVSSSKELSNVVLEFADGDRQRFEGLTSHSGTFAGTGDNAGKTITAAWIKSGDNASGDGPGLGVRKDLDSSSCDTTTGTSGRTLDDTGTGTGSEDSGTIASGDARTQTTTRSPAVPDADDTASEAPAQQVRTAREAVADEAPSTEARVLGSTDERELNAATDTDVRAADSLPMTGMDSLAALLAALGALGLGTGLVRRARRA